MIEGSGLACTGAEQGSAAVANGSSVIERHVSSLPLRPPVRAVHRRDGRDKNKVGRSAPLLCKQAAADERFWRPGQPRYDRLAAAARNAFCVEPPSLVRSLASATDDRPCREEGHGFDTPRRPGRTVRARPLEATRITNCTSSVCWPLEAAVVLLSGRVLEVVDPAAGS